MNRGPDYDLAKYRVKVSHFWEQGFDTNGIIHVGAHDGEEVQYYQMMGIDNILCFEPLPEIVEVFKKTYPSVPIFKTALGDHTGQTEFNVTNDGRQGQGSSIYPPLDEVYAMTGGVREQIIVPISRFDDFIREHNLDTSLFDTVVIDVQGAELAVLKGFGELLPNFKYFNIECSELPTYEGGATAQEVVDYMAKKGFTQDSPIVSHDDVFFIRSDIKPESDLTYRGLA